LRWCALTAAVLILFGGCAAPKEELRIGVVAELSGPLSAYGRACLDGVRLAVSEWNENGGVRGKTVCIRTADTRSQSGEAALGALRLQSEGVCGIIGPTTSTGVKAALAAGPDIPLISPTATADSIGEGDSGDWFFRICYTDSAQGSAMGEYARRLGFCRAVLLVDSGSDYSRGISHAFARSFQAGGGRIAGTEYYTATDADFTALLTGLSRYQYDCIYLPGYYAEAGLLIRQARQLGIDAAFLSGDAFDSPFLSRIIPDPAQLDGIYYTNHCAPEGEETADFARRFETAFGYVPGAYAILGYDAANWLLSAVEEGGQTPGAIRDLLEKSREFPGVGGSFSIDGEHNAKKQVRLIRICRGERETVI